MNLLFLILFNFGGFDTTKVKPIEIVDYYNSDFRLILNDTRAIYPLIVTLTTKYKNFEITLSKCKTKKEKEILTENFGNEFENIFIDKLFDLTKSQGKLLVKILQKETGKSVYDIIYNIKGSFKANIYQSLALSVGNDLKSKYDEIADRKIKNALNIVINEEN